MAMEPINHMLRSTRDLAQQLVDQCRGPRSSYKPLSSSIKELRNVLEKLEDHEAEDSSLSSAASSVILLEQVSRTHVLLQNLRLAAQNLRQDSKGDMNEADIANFKSNLDVLSKELTASHRALFTGEIPLKLDTNTITGVTSMSRRRKSGSTSPTGSWHERRSSVGTASSYSSASVIHDRQPSDEKETYEPGSARSQNFARKWLLPFATPDPLSASIEQATSIILREDDFANEDRTDTPTADPDSFLSSRTTDLVTPMKQRQLGLPPGDSNEGTCHTRQQSPTPTSARPRSASESVRPSLESSVIRRDSSFSNGQRELDDGSHTSDSLLRHISSASPHIQHLSPDVVPRGFGRRTKSYSGGTITFGTRSVVAGERVTDHTQEARPSINPMRKELSVVAEATNQSGTEEFVSDEGVPSPRDVPKPQEWIAGPPSRPPPMPPSRRPPSPPKQRRIPKIPKRSSTYRIVNATLQDESSSDENDFNTESKAAPPSVPEQPAVSDPQEEAISTTGVAPKMLGENQGALSRADRQQPRRQRTNHAQKVLMARAEYTTPEAASHSPRSGLAGEQFAHPSSTAVDLVDSSPRRLLQDKAPALDVRKLPPVPLKKPHLQVRRFSSQSPNTPVLHNEKEVGNRSELPGEDFGRVEMYASAEVENGKELASSSVVFNSDGVKLRSKKSTRMSADAAMDINDLSDSAVGSQLTSTHSQELSIPQPGQASSTNSAIDHTEWYGRTENATDDTDLDAERVNHIVHFWNLYSWDLVESYLNGYLESLLERETPDRARRVRHLLGVCSSFKGRWVDAIPHFLSVLKPSGDKLSKLDDGDCAAAYWLGDCYALLNRRDEALLAYRLAARSSIFQDPRLRDSISAEQEALQFGQSNADLTLGSTHQSFNGDPTSLRSALGQSVVQKLLESYRGYFNQLPRHFISHVEPHKSRASSLRQSFLAKNQRLKLAALDFESFAPWPMIYDPLLSIANVRRGRLLEYECDLLAVYQTNPSAKVPKSSPISLARLETFTCADLFWLIKTIRDCLRCYEMDWSEVANVEGTWFVVRYSFMESRFATTHYFSMSIFKQTMKIRSGQYGVEICPDGIFTARIVRTGVEYLYGVHESESKRVKKLIREYLDVAAKSEVKTK